MVWCLQGPHIREVTINGSEGYLRLNGAIGDDATITVHSTRLAKHVLDDPRVSRKHIEIRVIRDHFVIFDLNSSGGTYVNGQRVNQGILYPGDLISLAGVNMVFTRDTRFMHQNDASGQAMGPGQRPTAVFDQTLFERKKKSN